MMYLGTSAATLSLLHVAEAVAGSPYLDTFIWPHTGWEPVALVETPDGVREIPQREVPGCSRSFGVFDEWAAQEGLFRDGELYGARVRVFRARAALELSADRLRKDPGCLLCPRGECPACDLRWPDVP